MLTAEAQRRLCPKYRTKPSFTAEIAENAEVAREDPVASGFIPDADRDPVLDVAHKVRRYDPLGVSACSAVSAVTMGKIWDQQEYVRRGQSGAPARIWTLFEAPMRLAPAWAMRRAVS